MSSNSLVGAIKQGDLESIQSQLQADPLLFKFTDVDERTLVHHAILGRQHAILKWLLEQEECIVETTDEAGWNAMHIAASIGDTESITQLLCHQKASRLLNTKNETGNSPLHYAASKGHLDAIRILMENQADPLVENKYRQTPVHRAAVHGHCSIIRCIVEGTPLRYRSGLVDAQDAEGDTALHMAAQEGHEEAVSILLEYGARRDIRNKEGLLAIP